MKHKIITFLLFQLGWFACVLGAANSLASVGIMISLIVVWFHLRTTQHKFEETALIGIVTIIGFSWDSALVQLGYFQYSNTASSTFAPLWIVAMWTMFASTINTLFSWLKNRLLIAFLLGAVFGPIAYWSASQLGAVNILDFPNALLLQSIGWGILMPGMLILSKLIYRNGHYPSLEKAK